MFGRTTTELIGLPAWNLAKPEIREQVKALFFKKAQERDKSPLEVECIKKDKTTFWAEIKFSLLQQHLFL